MLVLNEQDFYERLTNSCKFGFSYIGKGMFVHPKIGGWKILDKNTWREIFSSNDREKLYKFYIENSI